jgi:hypothetical protein
MPCLFVLLPDVNLAHLHFAPIFQFSVSEHVFINRLLACSWSLS